MAKDPDEEIEWTAADLAAIDPEFRAVLKRVTAEHNEYLDSLDQEQLRVVRTGGNQVITVRDGREVQISVYRTGSEPAQPE